MKRLSIVIFPGIAVVALAALFLRGSAESSAATVAQFTRTSSACGVWSRVASPNVGTSTNFLNGVTAISAKNVWAVERRAMAMVALHWWNIGLAPDGKWLPVLTLMAAYLTRFQV